METIGLLFILVKIVDGARYIQRINVIMMTLISSVNLMVIFLGVLLTFNTTMVPLAQAIWGTSLVGYKSFDYAQTSVLMIAYSKGNLEALLDINFVWSLIFMIMYYSVPLFFLHAAFHMIQTDSLKNIVMANSLQEDDVIANEKAQ